MLQCKVHAGRIHPARASPPLPALSCTRQGSFRSLSGVGGRKSQETPQPPLGPSLSARTHSADEAPEVRSPQSRLPRRCSLQAAACAHLAKQSSSPLIQVSALHTGATPRLVLQPLPSHPASRLRVRLLQHTRHARARTAVARLQLQPLCYLFALLIQLHRCCRHLSCSTGRVCWCPPASSNVTRKSVAARC